VTGAAGPTRKSGFAGGPRQFPPRDERPENKIDGVVALITAHARAMMGDDGGSVYDERGLIVL
jgi:hypothetical protein